MKFFFSLLFLTAFVFPGCLLRDNKGKVDPFYTDRGGFGLRRIPLIKPYELRNVSANEWRMELHSPELLALSIHNVKGVNVNNGRILLYSEGSTEVRNVQYNRIWLIIYPDSMNLEAFYEYSSYLDNLRLHSIKDSILKNPDSLYDSFYESRKIKWD